MVELLVVAGDADFEARCDETVAAEVMARDMAEARFEGAIKQMSYQNVNVIAQTKIKTRNDVRIIRPRLVASLLPCHPWHAEQFQR